MLVCGVYGWSRNDLGVPCIQGPATCWRPQLSPGLVGCRHRWPARSLQSGRNQPSNSLPNDPHISTAAPASPTHTCALQTHCNILTSEINPILANTTAQITLQIRYINPVQLGMKPASGLRSTRLPERDYLLSMKSTTCCEN